MFARYGELLVIGLLLVLANVQAQVQLGVNLDVNQFKNSIQDWIRHSNPNERAGFVKGLMEKASVDAAKSGYSVMVCNMNNEYVNRLIDVAVFQTVNQYEKNWGIWVFRCGHFENKGDAGWINWAFYGDTKRDGDKVDFYSSKCPDANYRQRRN